MIQTKLIRGSIWFKNSNVDIMPKRALEFFKNSENNSPSFFYALDIAINDWILDNPDKEIIQIHYQYGLSNNESEYSALIEYEQKEKDDDEDAKEILNSILKHIENLSDATESNQQRNELQLISDCVEKYLEKLN